jgi:23S rRNA (cytosine1962-C5)-methyltransferase
VVGFGAEDRPEEMVAGRLREAFRRRLPRSEGGAPMRLVFAEADLLPGLVVDLYPPYAVVQSSTAGMDLMLPELETRVAEVYAEVFETGLAGMVLRGDSSARRLEGLEVFRRVCFGDPAALAQVVVAENGVRYVADLVSGQKTGFFIDQRENRGFLGNWVRERTGAGVLDLYCYSGGWGLRALREGAGRVTFVDQSREAFALLEKGLSANDLPRARADLVPADVFEFLLNEEPLYDVVVADPPAFVKSRKEPAPGAEGLPEAEPPGVAPPAARGGPVQLQLQPPPGGSRLHGLAGPGGCERKRAGPGGLSGPPAGGSSRTAVHARNRLLEVHRAEEAVRERRK